MGWKKRLAIQSALYLCLAIVIIVCDVLSGHYSMAANVALIWILADWILTNSTFKEQEERIDRLQQEIRDIINPVPGAKPETGIMLKGEKPETGIME